MDATAGMILAHETGKERCTGRRQTTARVWPWVRMVRQSGTSRPKVRRLGLTGATGRALGGLLVAALVMTRIAISLAVLLVATCEETSKQTKVISFSNVNTLHQIQIKVNSSEQ